MWKESMVAEVVGNFSATIDDFHINVKNYIDRIGGGIDGEVANCFASGVTTAAAYAADPFCSQLSRSASGDLLAVQPYVNSGSLLTSGLDFALNYAFELEQIGLPAS